jgi:hypothetical protein
VWDWIITVLKEGHSVDLLFLLLSIAGWLMASCIIMSFIEFFAHRYLMHKRTLPHVIYKFIPGLNRLFQNHAVLHHGRYYKVFNHEDDPQGRQISIRLDLWAPLIGGPLVWALTYPLSPLIGPAFVTVVVLHHFAWNLIHNEMHNPKPRWFGKTSFFKFFARYHWMHHKYPGKNYNIIFPGADFVFGKHVKPNASDIAEMRSIGM